MVQKADTQARRGRPRSFHHETALAQATTAFWRRGFAATSLDDVTAATGLNRPSIYGAFGGKRELYLAALDRYVAQSAAAMGALLDPALPLADGLARVYDRALALYFADAEAPLGCFLIGTAATEAATDADVRAKLGDGLRQLTAAFAARFRAAVAGGELPRDADPALLAELAGAVLHSIALRARAGDARAALRRFAHAAVGTLCGTATRRRRRRA
jgi:AcrR family transcriptional regulator